MTDHLIPRRNPFLYEVNTAVFLNRLSKKYGRPLTLATVPGEEWQRIADSGFDLVWLMGVWRRSPRAHEQALNNVALSREYTRILPDWTEDDVVGSAYAIYDYSLDSLLGKPAELAELKIKLNAMGLGLVLDFVANHLGFDHPWTMSNPERLVRGSMNDVRDHPDWFYWRGKGNYLAYGRDPNFPPWIDTVQVNFFSDSLRQALVDELLKIAEVADGVRCDVAMLGLNAVFERVWGSIVKDYPRPKGEFWAEAISRVKQQHPGFKMLAEVYWDLETELQQLGFDFTYDKRFYDRLLFSSPGDIRRYLAADAQYQQRTVRFLENHDESRAVVAFGHERSLAAAVILATVPGLRMLYDGQFEGRHVHMPVHFTRELEEPVHGDILDFYKRLMQRCNTPVFHDGEWQLIAVKQSHPGNESYRNLLSWRWRLANEIKMVVVNYSPEPAQGWLELTSNRAKRFSLHEEPSGRVFTAAPGELINNLFYVDLRPYHAYFVDLA